MHGSCSTNAGSFMYYFPVPTLAPVPCGPRVSISKCPTISADLLQTLSALGHTSFPYIKFYPFLKIQDKYRFLHETFADYFICHRLPSQLNKYISSSGCHTI